MALALPGVKGRPIYANNFKDAFEANPRILTWISLVSNATFMKNAAPVMAPRKGPYLARCSINTPLFETNGDYSFSSFPTALDAGFWHIGEQFTRAGDFGFTYCGYATDGFTEPMSIRFSNGDRVYPRPNHNAGGTGLVYRISGVDNLVNLGTSGPLNALHYVNCSYASASRTVSYQLNGGQIFKAVAPAAWSVMDPLTQFNIVVGQAIPAQRWGGYICDTALWASDFLSNDDDLALVADYMATTYGIGA